MEKITKWVIAIAMGLMLVTTACGAGEHEQSGEAGSVSFQLLVGNTNVTAVSFTVTGVLLAAPLEGQFNVRDGSSPQVFEAIMDLLAGTYDITIEALDGAGAVLCTETESFTIVGGQTTDVNMVLECHISGVNEDLGHVNVGVTFDVIVDNVCPRLNGLRIIPDVLAEGASTDVEVTAQDFNLDDLHVTLSATEGTFSGGNPFDIVDPANSAVRQYTCPTTPGTHTVTATVIDEDPLCEKTLTAIVHCGYTQTVSLVCNNDATDDVFVLPYELTATPLGSVVDGVPMEIALTGTVNYPASLVNLAVLRAAPYPLTESTLRQFKVTVVPRSGATGAPVVLGLGTPPAPLPMQIQFPLIYDAGECGLLGLPTPCADEPVLNPMESVIGTFTPTGGPGGSILLGWDESDIPPVSIDPASPGPNAFAETAAGTDFAVECFMGTIDDNGTPGNTTDDFPRALLDGDLLEIPIN